MKPTIFISHRSTDKVVADMLTDFFSNTGIPRDSVFCSSLPGNDVNEKISEEIKDALKFSAVNIAILSRDYYTSTYCLNEAGVLWFLDVPVIPIALPEISTDNMHGFLNHEYKLRRLDSDDDIAYIYDTVSEKTNAAQSKHSIVTSETSKLKTRYAAFLVSRAEKQPGQHHLSTQNSVVQDSYITDITTDDERIVLYYMLQANVRKIDRESIERWLCEEEIYDVNIDNAFDLLSYSAKGMANRDTLELGIDTFRWISSHSQTLSDELKQYIERHRKLASDTFLALWNEDKFDDFAKLFIAYIVDEKVHTFGCRWKADEQLNDIKAWEDKNIIFFGELSSKYDAALAFLIDYNLVYESDWTSCGNAKEYTLQSSLQKLLFECPQDIKAQLEFVKSEFNPLKRYNSNNKNDGNG